MDMHIKSKHTAAIIAWVIFLAIVCFSSMVDAGESEQAADGFSSWLLVFKQEAQEQGISLETLDAALSGVQPIPQAITQDRSQPEFIQTFTSYVHQRVTPLQVRRGRNALYKNQLLFESAEKEHGVPAPVLVAFWGMETNYGTTKGDFSTPATLATLAYEGRRRDFFKAQLVDLLRIIQAGHVEVPIMRGSWAGAMGHMQFMPSTFNAYAVDGDGDGKINVWQSLPDAVNSAANYLKIAGWQAGQPVAMEVQLPDNFDWNKAQLLSRIPVAEWAGMGVKPVGPASLPKAAGDAAIILPQGWRGPAFMVFDNFYVIMQWNRSINYALSVAHLSERISGGSLLVGDYNVERDALSIEQMMSMQKMLLEQGFEVGEIDGMPGLQTQIAIRKYQQLNHLPADGYPSSSLLSQMEASVRTAPADFAVITTNLIK